MHPVPWDLVGRLALSGLLGAVVGFEREIHGHPAGLRTHILVSLGATLATLVSMQVYADHSAHADPGRIAAQIVTGVGFLGAGAIIREGVTVRGLTTAASVWTTAMIGLAVGASARTAFLGIVVTGMMLAVLWWLHLLRDAIQERGHLGYSLDVRLAPAAGGIKAVMDTAATLGVSVQIMQIERRHDPPEQILQMHVRKRRSLSREALLAALADLPGVRSVALD